MRGCALIADSSPLFREGLRRLLRLGRFVVTAEGRDVSEAKKHLKDDGELALVVCTITGETAPVDIAALAELRHRYAGLKIIAITDFAPAPAAWRQLLEMSDAMLARDISSEVLQRSIDLVMAGQKFLSAPLLKVVSSAPAEIVEAELPANAERRQPGIDAIDQVKPILVQESPVAKPTGAMPYDQLNLSDRERQILQCLVRGDPNKVIARELRIAEATVKVHVKGLLRKLRAANRTQAAVWALNHGLVSNGVAVLAAE